MRFVFLGPEVRLQLPSDATSRWPPLLFGSEFPSSRPPEDFHLQVTSRFGFPYRFPNNVHHARRFAPCPAHGPAVNITEAAAEWGFWHMGKFAADYRRQFGELPSETLRRTRPLGRR
jgi:AraC-like DNA-binding protein